MRSHSARDLLQTSLPITKCWTQNFVWQQIEWQDRNRWENLYFWYNFHWKFRWKWRYLLVQPKGLCFRFSFKSSPWKNMCCCHINQPRSWILIPVEDPSSSGDSINPNFQWNTWPPFLPSHTLCVFHSFRSMYSVWKSLLEGTIQVAQSRLNICENYKNLISEPARNVRCFKEQQLKKVFVF